MPGSGGTYDLRFALQASGRCAGRRCGAARHDVMARLKGVFTVELDFGAIITSGDFQLQIGVRPGASAGAFPLSPRPKINPTPQAQVSG
ncbi:MAG: hypothetical protein IPK97_16970, partial [Ahniella sp.]|nr:hypothetical protein [Ahniella sp.]